MYSVNVFFVKLAENFKNQETKKQLLYMVYCLGVFGVSGAVILPVVSTLQNLNKLGVEVSGF